MHRWDGCALNHSRGPPSSVELPHSGAGAASSGLQLGAQPGHGLVTVTGCSDEELPEGAALITEIGRFGPGDRPSTPPARQSLAVGLGRRLPLK